MKFVSKQLSQFPNLNRISNNKSNNRKKVHLIFDEIKRKDYLTGFKKRKQQRRQIAHEKLKLELKEEKKRIKKQIKNEYMLTSHRNIPELEELLSQKEYETDGRTVSILELNLNDLTRSSSWIGDNIMTNDENTKTVDGDFSSTSNCHNNEEILSKKKLSNVVRKKITQKTLESKVFQRKQNLERKKNKHVSQHKKYLKQRALKSKKNNNKKKN